MQSVRMDEPSEIPSRLKALRERAKLSVREMARRVGMSSSGYSHYEIPGRFKDATLPLAQAILFSRAMIGTAVDPDEIVALSGLAHPSNDGDLPTHGFSEVARPFNFQEHAVESGTDQPILRSLFGHGATTPATFEIGVDMPAFALLAGDVVLVELSRLPQPGELALISHFDDKNATSTWSICRYFPPYLQPGGMKHDGTPLRVDQPGVTVRHPVIGSMRGIPRD